MEKKYRKITIFAYLTPNFLLTKLAGFLANKELGFLTQIFIKLFIKSYKINVSECKIQDLTEFKTFNQFFIRELQAEARVIDENQASLVFPADSTISSFGVLNKNILLQAKSHYFSLEDLLANQMDLVAEFMDGAYIVNYLSPTDYHRVHMPCNAKLIKMIYVPGELFSVKPKIVSTVPNLFAKNERVICYFTTNKGLMIQILVGATITASISTTWHGIINKSRKNKNITEYDYTDQEILFTKGQEMGNFQMGSTVINLFPKNTITFSPELDIAKHFNIGDKMATYNDAP